MQPAVAVPMGEEKSGHWRELGRRLLGHVGTALSLVIACLALWALFHTLQHIEIASVVAAFEGVTAGAMLLAVGCTAASYLVLTGYDVLALRHIGRSLPYARAALASFLAYAFGNNIGFSLVTGASVRYRIYTPAGLSAVEIAAVSLLCAGTFAIGTMAILAILMLTGGEVFQHLHVPGMFSQSVGFAVLIVLALYLLLTSFSPLTIRTSTWSIRLPSARMASAQLALALVDLSLAASVLYVLLPVGVAPAFPLFLAAFVLSLMAGTASHVPAGIGVFETVMLVTLPEVPPATLLGSILVFRCIYYLLPLAVGGILFAGHEISLRPSHIHRARGLAVDLLAEIGPQIMASILLLAGVVLLFSASLPSDPSRLTILVKHLPLWGLEVSHVLSSVAGVGIVLLSHALTRRLRAAHGMVCGLLVLGLLASLLKGLDFLEAGVMAAVLILLRIARDEFPRPGSPLDHGLPVEWFSTLNVILLVALWIGLFSYKEVPYSPDLFWTFALDGDYPRFLRAMAVAVAVPVAATVVHLRRPPAPPAAEGTVDVARVRRIIRTDPNARAYLALLGDKRLLYNEAGTAFLMYRVRGKSWVALGDPVGPASEREGLIMRFQDLAVAHNGWPIFYLADAAGLPLYVDLGLTALKVGDDARVPLADFALERLESADLQATHARIRAAGYSFAILPSAKVAGHLTELQGVSDAWLATNRTREKGFANGVFRPDYVRHFPCAVIARDHRIVAFAVLWAGADKEELAVDLLRYGPDALPGMMDYLLIELMQGGRERGYRWFNLGVAPFSSIGSHALAPLWHRVGGLFYRQSEHFRAVESLRPYEEKFHPVWRSKYLVVPPAASVPSILRDIAKLIDDPRP